MSFSILPPALVVGRDVSVDDFFAHIESRPFGWDGRIALDTETTGIDTSRDVPVYASASDGESRWLLCMEHILDPRFCELLDDPQRMWVFANAKFDMHMFCNVGLPEIRGDVVDVIVMCMLLDENRKGGAGLGLKEQARDYLDIRMRSFADTFGIKVKASDEGRALLDADVDLVAGYASLDAYATWLLSEEHNITLHSTLTVENLLGYRSLGDYYFQLEMPFTKTLWRMERRGIRVDVDALKALEGPMGERVKELKREIIHIAKRPINPASPAQLKDVFFSPRSEGGLGLKPKKYTASGAPSTDEATLQAFRATVPLADKILEYRSLTKLLNTYIIKLQDVCSREQRIHCALNQTGTVTGRLSSSKPNLQNIPAKGDAGKQIRSAFVGESGGALMVADYSQMEMCVMAHVSGDKAMIRAISDGLDLHSFTASRMLGVEYDDVVYAKKLDDVEEDKVEYAMSTWELTRDHAERIIADAGKLLGARRAAKAIGFGLMYGRGPGALAEELGVTRSDAKGLIEDWFNTFPDVRRYINHVQDMARFGEGHCVYTVFGRPRRLTSITSSNNGVRAKAERDAINAPIQGSASCITKYAMLLIDQDPVLGGDCLAGGSFGTQLLLQVHDEIILSVPVEDKTDEEIEWANNRLRELMEQAAPLSVPLKATGGIASNWGDAK
jgi:DNA polymerase-1